MGGNIKSTYKSNDTEEWLDKVFTRPLGYRWALFFKRFHVHPNTVTVLSMIIGAGSAFFFAHGSFRTEGRYGLLCNVIAVLLLAWANVYDSADGQLARLTGQKTRPGRILDGAAGDVWFIPIYVALVYRLSVHHGLEFAVLGIEDNAQNAFVSTIILVCVGLYSGFGCHSAQCRLADYYRQIHLFFLREKENCELDTFAQQQEMYKETPWKGNFLWKIFLWLYVGYTKKQEACTPCFQELMKKLQEKYGGAGHIPQTFCERFRNRSLPMMKWANVLTFNTRAVVLYAACLIDLPWLYFVFEIAVMSIIYRYMHVCHERFCKQFAEEL